VVMKARSAICGRQLDTADKNVTSFMIYLDVSLCLCAPGTFQKEDFIKTLHLFVAFCFTQC
jgi:hypothetical protein